MNWRRLGSRAISEVQSAAQGALGPRNGFRVLMYHAIGTPADRDTRGLYSIPPSLFTEHMRYLTNFKVCPVHEIAANNVSGNELRVALTFDDGYRDNLYEAAPVLSALNLPFSIFISTGFTQSAHPSFLSPAEIKQLAGMPNATIGTHGSTHTPLTKCSKGALRNELGDSRKYLEDLLGRRVDKMSYPFGAVDQGVRDAVEEAGYVMAFCSRFDINLPGRDPLLLCRTDVLGMDSIRVLKQKLRGAWDWYRWRSHDPASK